MRPNGPPSRGEEVAPVRVQVRFERFPSSIRGAFVMAGADGNPHAIRIESADLVRIPDGPVKAVPVEDRQLDVAPARDLFVPFEVTVTELDPGWYRVASSVRVDGGRSWTFEGRPFTIPWPRNDVRRGVVEVGGRVDAGGREFEVQRVELGPDAAVVVWRSVGEEPETGGEHQEAVAVLFADGEALPGIPPVPGARAFEPRQPGERRSVGYPVPRRARSLEVVIDVGSGRRSDPVSIPLP